MNLDKINRIISLKQMGGSMCILLLALCACQPKEQTQKENLPYYNTANFTPNWYTETQLDTLKLHKISDFSFIDQEGKKVSNETVKGKIYVANFFFTICPSICPNMTQNLLTVHHIFKNDADILMLSHSVMPATDTVAQLKKYANRWEIDAQRWHLLTGEKDKIYALARQSYFAEKEIGLQKDKNEFLHTENAFLIDKNGYIRGVYNATLALDVENLVKDIQNLKAEL
ncbi:SCO family protein [Emticicia sp. W12TSBA100-4]|uniref:SCO family protein n=1 Tax=Emticicia sp. W12TSBA100-4 TaxID=3160965 RepID=UPI0033066ABF